MIDADPQILDAAEHLFLSKGFHGVRLADIAHESGVGLPAVQMHFPTTAALLNALLQRRDPRADLRHALQQLSGATPEDMLRDAVERILQIMELNGQFVGLALMDTQVNQGQYLTNMFQDLTTDAANFMNRLSTMAGVRPISTMMLGRALAAMLIGFMATQQLAPPHAQFALRVFPQKAWVDGMTDILLHGILESR